MSKVWILHAQNTLRHLRILHAHYLGCTHVRSHVDDLWKVNLLVYLPTKQTIVLEPAVGVAGQTSKSRAGYLGGPLRKLYGDKIPRKKPFPDTEYLTV